MNHPFTAPREEDLHLLESDPGKVLAKAYDVILNGWELGGGSIRIHDRETQAKVFRLLGMTDEEARDRFGFFLEALEYGTPPHGGLALGLDRILRVAGRRVVDPRGDSVPEDHRGRGFDGRRAVEGGSRASCANCGIRTDCLDARAARLLRSGSVKLSC